MDFRTTSTESNTPPALSVAELEYQVEGWIYDGQARQQSPETTRNRRHVTAKLLWFLRHREFTHCGLREIRAFFAYLNTGHEEAAGRWGENNVEGLSGRARTRAEQPMKATTVRYYYTYLRALFNWIVAEGVLAESPMARLAAPIAREDQIEPFSREEMYALLDAAERGAYPRRDVALIRFLYDTGVRSAELCGIVLADLDIHTQRVTIRGKGHKDRAVYYGMETRRALWALLGPGGHRLPGSSPLFPVLRGPTEGQPFTRNGLLHLLRAIGKRAGVPNCHPHRFRHSFAVHFLTNGGNQFSLSHLLGHSNLTMTQKYIKLAQADLEDQHRRFSPGDDLKPSQRRK